MNATAASAKQPVALVAGASRGIGADTARAFARAGYAVVVGARDAAALDRVVESIEGAGGRAVATRTDVGDVDSMRALVELAVDSFGRLDAAFNNATDGPMPAPLADIDPDEFDVGHSHKRARHVPRDEVRDSRHARQWWWCHRQYGVGRRRARDDEP